MNLIGDYGKYKERDIDIVVRTGVDDFGQFKFADGFKPSAPVVSAAIFSPDFVYRYALSRYWGGEGETEKIVNFVMLNPSKAAHNLDDPTVRGCRRRAQKWGYNGIVVTNLFGLRSTDPAGLRTVLDPVGPINDRLIKAIAEECDLVVCAWGSEPFATSRRSVVENMLRDAGVELHALRLSTAGIPWHPLYLPGDLTPFKWELAA